MKRVWQAFLYSLQGLHTAWQSEAAFRQECILALVALPVAYLIAPDKIAMICMQASVVLVLIVELINTAIEAATDRHGQEIHPLAKKAKDCASAAVFIALLLAVMIWVLLLI